CSRSAATDHDGIGELRKRSACWRLILFSRHLSCTLSHTGGHEPTPTMRIFGNDNRSAHAGDGSRKRPIATQQSLDRVVLSRLELQGGSKQYLVRALTVAAQKEVQRLAFFAALHECVQIRAPDLRCIGQDQALPQKEAKSGELTEVAILRDRARPVPQGETMKEVVAGTPP